ncbi:MAG: ABC transporter substrate-binding protein [Candidatus Dormibacteraeota bacterium]|nr:ABC transporter substrate-binding protein [Candidatus Dormibacteraeota bacterium]
MTINRRQAMKLGGTAAALALAPGLVATRASAAGMTGAGRRVKAGGTFSGAFDEGPGGQPELFNPLTATAGATSLQLLYSPLVNYTMNFQKQVGDLATSWTLSPDATKYTFKLRPGITWHDGQPFTSQDVKFTLQLAQNPASASTVGANLPPISSIDTPSDTEVRVTFATPNVTVLNSLASLPMLPQHLLSKYSPSDLVKSQYWSGNPVGTGPFQWGKYVQGQYTQLKAFPKYWRGKPKLDTLINTYFSDPAASVIALQKQSIQFDYLALADAQNLKGSKNIKVISGSSMVVNYLGWNFKDLRFKDLRVRQAFMHAIDRKTIIARLYQGGATLVNGPFDNPKYQSPSATKYDYNPKKAKQLLKAANWDAIKGSPIEIVTYYTDQTTQSVLTAFQQQLGAVGIQVTLRQVDSVTFGGISKAGKFTMIFAGRANGPDPDATRTAFISTATPPAGANYLGINISQLDQLYAQGLQEVNATKRAGIYQDIYKTFSEQLPIGPMWVAKRYGGVARSIANFKWSPNSVGFYDAEWQSWGRV